MPNQSLIPVTTHPARDGRRKRTRLTNELIDTVAEAVRKGVKPETALVSLGIARRTAHEWMQIGRGEHPQYTPHARHERLVYECDRAKAEFLGGTIPRWSEPGSHYKLQMAAAGAFDSDYRDVKERETARPDAAYALVQMLAAHYLEAPLDARVLEAPEAERDAE